MMPMWRMVSIALHDGYYDDDRDDGFVDREDADEVDGEVDNACGCDDDDDDDDDADDQDDDAE